MYGGKPSDMKSLIPKANFGQTLGSIGDTNLAKNLDMAIPGLGTGIDAALDLAGFFGDKKVYNEAQEDKKAAGSYITAIESGPNKGGLDFSAGLSGAKGFQDYANTLKKPNFGRDFLLPTVMSVGESAIGGGLGNLGLENLQIGKSNAQDILSGITGIQKPDFSEMGGSPRSDVYEAEGNEVIQHEPGAPPGTTGKMEPIGNNPMLSELKGKSHAAGGELVDSVGQQVVYSKKLKSKTWGISFADAAKKIGKKIETFEKAAAEGDHITKQTAQSMIRSWIVKLQELQAEQEAARKEKFTQLLQDGSSFEELQQSFPDLTDQFMQANAGPQKQVNPTEGPMAPIAPMEQQFLYGGKNKMMYGSTPKYAYGMSADPNDPPFYEGRRTDEDVDALQDTFMTYNGHKIYGNDQGIKDYIQEIGMDEFARQWMANMDPELLEFAGIQEFGDLFENNGDKLKMLQRLYNEKNAGQPGFTPIPVDSGVGKFGEHSMSMAGWKELEDSATNPDGPISGGDQGNVPNPNNTGDPGILDDDFDLGEIEDPLADDDGIMEEEEEIEIYRDPNLGPQRGPRDDMAPIATGDPIQDRAYQIEGEPELEITELDLEDDEEEEEEIVYDQQGNIIYDPAIDKPGTIPGNPLELRGPIRLTEYEGVELPPNTQTKKKDPPPYMGDAPYTDIVADNAGVPLQPGPGKKPPFTGGYFTGQDDGVDDILPGMYDDEAMYYNRPTLEDADMYREDVQLYKDDSKIKKPKWKAGGTEDPMFGPFPENDRTPYRSKNRWWERDPNKKNKKEEEEEEIINNNINKNEEIINNKGATDTDKTQAFNNRKFFQGLSKYASPLYNLMKSKEGAEIEKKQVNPYEKDILKELDQTVDIQPWLNQNMMSMKGGMDFSKDFASGNPMQMFNMYNRLNQGKMMQDSAAWKYKHDAEGKLGTARANMMFNLGERDRAESVRVAGVNSQNRAAVDKYVSTAIEQLSAIGQLDEYTANLMENDKLRASFINAMAPDLQKYMNNNPDAGVDESITNVMSTLTEEDIQNMINNSVGNIPVNINITPGDNNTNVTDNTGTNNEVVTGNNEDPIDANNVLSGGEFINPLDEATSNVQNVGTPIDVSDDMRFNSAFDHEVNGNLFTPIEGEPNRYSYDNQTYVKIKQGNSELYIPEEEAIQKGLITEEDINVDMDDVVLDGNTGGDGTGGGNNIEYTPIISADQMASLEPMSIQSTGAGKANILENGQPIQVEVDGGMLKVNGVRAEGDKIVVDGSVTMLGVDLPSTRDFGEFIQDSNSASGFKWVPNEDSWEQFQANASAEQKAMFANFIAAVEGDVRYAEALRNQISGGEGTLTGAQLNDTIRNKPE